MTSDSDIPDTFDTSDLSFDDLAEIRSFVDARKLSDHIEGFCTCDEKREGQR